MEIPRVLIADDNAHVREALRLLLKPRGFLPETANSPQAVLDAIQDRHFDLLLLDMNYARDTTSGSEGLQLLSEIRAWNSELPVMLMSAWGTIDLAVEVMQLGACGFVQKPWDNARLLASLWQKLEEARTSSTELLEAETIQKQMLPAEVPEVCGYEIRSFWKPAHKVGGDYFDVIRLSPSTAAICIADVAGKGLPAAMLMCNLQANVRHLVQSTVSPRQLCQQLNAINVENNQSARFTTLFYGVLDSASSSLRYANAGHVPPILIRQDGTVVRLSEGGTILGIFPEARYDEAVIPFNRGDRLILLTDGIAELADQSGVEFGDTELVRVILDNRHRSPMELHRKILDAMASFAPLSPQDDATFVIIAALD
jgi:sigma-B regulation protein RsbU (phosphoserine phosphatase)